MWTRDELKQKAKKSFRKYYLGAVIVCLIALLFTTEYGNPFSGGSGSRYNQSEGIEDSINFSETNLESNAKDIINLVRHNPFVERGLELLDHTLEPLERLGSLGAFVAKFIEAPVVFAVYALPLLFSVLMLCFGFLIGNPLQIGCKRYFMRNRKEQTKIGVLSYGFQRNYKNIAWSMFCRDIFITLWSLLLIVPGIIKSYEYRMVPYILSENPGITRKRAFQLSKRMMDGQKLDTFVLDLSFILWVILGAITFNLANIFYVYPYIEATGAELYAVLRGNALQKNIVNNTELPGFI